MITRIALITGAAGDLGRAVAIRLSTEGARVVLCDLNQAEAGLAETADLCIQANPDGPDPAAVAFDVTDEVAVDAAIEQVVATTGAPDAIFNNAGYQGQFANTTDYGTADFRRVLDVNVSGVFLVLRASAKAMIAANKPGSIVNTASMAATGAPNMVAYSASKAAVIGLTKSAARDLASLSIRVNAISPAFIGPGAMWDRQVALQAETPSKYYANTADEVAEQMLGQVPLGRYGTLEEVAAAVHFLLSSESSYLTGINIEIAGGVS